MPRSRSQRVGLGRNPTSVVPAELRKPLGQQRYWGARLLGVKQLFGETAVLDHVSISQIAA